jgi:calcineurin-like phosphoesterase
LIKREILLYEINNLLLKLDTNKKKDGNLSMDIDSLIQFNGKDIWTTKDACEGIQIFGGTGSGKSSGSGKLIAKSFLKAGFGGLILTVKKDEKDTWLNYAKATNREKDIVILTDNNGVNNQYFNFLQYEYSRSGRGSGLTENLVNLFMTVISNGDNYGNTNTYWVSTLKQLLRNTIDLVTIANDSISLRQMYDVITSAPQNIEEFKSSLWRKESKCFELIQKAEKNIIRGQNNDLKLDFEVTKNYWQNEFPHLDEKTRSIIVSMFTSRADCFLRGVLRKIFCSDEVNTISPEDTFEGKIIILDLPKKEYEETGQYAQVLFKYIWQRAVERRVVEVSTKPVFLWVDEAQYFYTDYDSIFQTTARSSRVCTVYLTQNIPNYESILGVNSATKVQSFLGNMQTKIFHANSDVTTNRYASQLIAQTYTNRQNSSQNGVGGQSYSTQRVLEDQVLPKEFAELKNGGQDNNLKVEAIIYQTGRKWLSNSDRNYAKVEISQE